MAETVYALCALTSLLCAILLARAFVASRTGLLLWCLVCFVGLAINNAMLFVDKVIAQDHDLAVWRAVPAALGVLALVYGLLRESARR